MAVLHIYSINHVCLGEKKMISVMIENLFISLPDCCFLGRFYYWQNYQHNFKWSANLGVNYPTEHAVR